MTHVNKAKRAVGLISDCFTMFLVTGHRRRESSSLRAQRQQLPPPAPTNKRRDFVPKITSCDWQPRAADWSRPSTMSRQHNTLSSIKTIVCLFTGKAKLQRLQVSKARIIWTSSCALLNLLHNLELLLGRRLPRGYVNSCLNLCLNSDDFR